MSELAAAVSELKAEGRHAAEQAALTAIVAAFMESFDDVCGRTDDTRGCGWETAYILQLRDWIRSADISGGAVTRVFEVAAWLWYFGWWDYPGVGPWEWFGQPGWDDMVNGSVRGTRRATQRLWQMVSDRTAGISAWDKILGRTPSGQEGTRV